jgi:hypothetical protein
MTFRLQTLYSFAAGLLLGFVIGLATRSCQAEEPAPALSPPPVEWPYLIGKDWATDTFQPTSADIQALTPITTLILKVNPHLTIWEVEAVAGTIYSACDQYDRVDPMLLAQLARFESTFKPYAVNKATGCHGLLQWMKCYHEDEFAKAGLDWDSPTDQCRFAAMHIQERLEAGLSVRKALAPWSVRDKAIRAWGNG